jgi:transcriptional regulator with XRE-family HTH domain
MVQRREPTARQVRLGVELRRLREAAGLTAVQSAALLGANRVQISHIESGLIGVSEERLRRLASHYACTDTEFVEALVAMATERTQGWWEEYRGKLPTPFLDLSELDHHAAYQRDVAVLYVPGLLQTEDYARALIREGHPEPEVERRVEFRMRRQHVLRRRPRPLNLWIVLDKAALWLPIGGAVTMRGQIQHIIELCRRPNVTVQIAPYGVSGRMAGDGPLTLVRFPQQGLQDMVYLERPDSAVYPMRRKEIERHWHVFNTLVTEAAPPERTPFLLAEMLTTY